MVLISLLLVFGVVSAGVFRLLRGLSSRPSFWSVAVSIGIGVGLVRASFACLGWYVVEHTGGPAQIPAFAMAMLAWPEAALLPRTGPSQTPARTYVLLFALLVVSSTTFVAAIAALARIGLRRGRD